ncbi:MAG TPA: transcription antiterminator LicT, partial [Candidatus Butyricicoccus avistercoris]|nr:transcription antiterminator LicT [Candidatus Butyricicoccus avistercoris]
MVIEKILNNNVVITRNLSGVETVIMGRGLAFGHSAGDEIDESKIEKTFTITN